MARGRTAIVVVAAGSGARMGGSTPKQYRPLAGTPLLRRTLDACLSNDMIDRIVCVIGPSHGEAYARCAPADPRLADPVIGGTTRQASVRAGLEALRGEAVDIVLIHDAARPFVDAALIERVVSGVEPGTGALPALPVVDSLARAEKDRVSGEVSRANLWRAQTPQGFRFADIWRAHEAADVEHTDDASLARAAGLAIRIVAGDRRNEKITTTEDFAMAQAALATTDVRVGHGYDTHRLVAGDAVTLCGVRIPHAHRLDGHSDADVGLHALTDALLATVGAGDIGTHFPPSDPQWEGAASDRFLRYAADAVRADRGTITHVDVTLVCEAPRIGPHRETMREAVARILELAVSRVSVKATTNEERGFVGRGEGIVALATATVVFA